MQGFWIQIKDVHRNSTINEEGKENYLMKNQLFRKNSKPTSGFYVAQNGICYAIYDHGAIPLLNLPSIIYNQVLNLLKDYFVTISNANNIW